MGQKVNPIGLRTALTKNWESRWFAGKALFGEWLHEDLKIRKFIKEKFAQAAIARIQIERFTSRIRVTIFSARPGVLFGKRGADLDVLRQDISKLTSNKEVFVEIAEIKRAEANAQLVAENIAMQLERAIQQAMDLGVDGIKVNCSGRLGGAELARFEQYKEGRVPLHTLKANIDYGFVEANTTAGKIGVNVWICHKEATEDQEYAINAKKSKVQKDSTRK